MYRSNNHYVLNFEDTYRLPDKRHREQLIMNFEMKHVNKYGDTDIKPYRWIKMEYTGSLGRIFNLLLPKCQTKFSYKAGKPYNISTFSNSEKWCFPQNWCFDNCWESSHLLDLLKMYKKLPYNFGTRFLIKIHLFVSVSCTMDFVDLVIHNSQIVHEIHENISIFKILFAYKFPHKTSYG